MVYAMAGAPLTPRSSIFPCDDQRGRGQAVLSRGGVKTVFEERFKRYNTFCSNLFESQVFTLYLEHLERNYCTFMRAHTAVFRTDILHVNGLDSIRILFSRGEIL